VDGSNFCSECGAPSETAASDTKAPPPAPPRRPPPPPITERKAIKEVWTPPSTNVLAIASLTLGLLWLVWVGSLGAVVLGHMAKRQITSSEGRQTGAGLATAGLVLGYIGLGFLLIYVIAAASVR
jgi:hypothetical protein